MRGWYVVLIVVTLASSVWADTITVKGHDKPIEGQIVNETDDVFVIEVPKSQIARIERGAPFLRRSTTAAPKVVWEEHEGYLILRIPQEQVERRSLAALPAPASPGANLLPSQADAPPHEAASTPVPPPRDTNRRLGSIGGRVLWDGKPLANCKVKTVMVSSSQPLAVVSKLLGRSEAYADEEGYVAETKTDASGRYRVERVPPGEYDVYWQPNGQSSSQWIRRLRDKPDLVVLEGEAARYPDIEAHVKTRN